MRAYLPESLVNHDVMSASGAVPVAVKVAFSTSPRPPVTASLSCRSSLVRKRN